MIGMEYHSARPAMEQRVGPPDSKVAQLEREVQNLKLQLAQAHNSENAMRGERDQAHKAVAELALARQTQSSLEARIRGLEGELSQERVRAGTLNRELSEARTALENAATPANITVLDGRIRSLEADLIAARNRAGAAETKLAQVQSATDELDELREWKAQMEAEARNRDTAANLREQQHDEVVKKLTAERDAAIRERDEARKGSKRR